MAAYQGQAAVGLLSTDLGTPAYPGSFTPSATTNTVLAGGADIWGTADAGYFVYTNLTSPVWDAVVKVQSLVNPGSSWGKVELMVRGDQGDGTGAPAANDMFIAEMTTQPSSYTATDAAGVNWVVDQFRTIPGASANWISGTTWATVSHSYAAGTPAPAYPNQWLRLTRSGSVFTTMDSTDGVTWNTSAVIDTANPTAQPNGVDANGATSLQFTQTFTNSVWLGIAVTAHNDATDADGNQYFATAVFSDLNITVPNELLSVTGSAKPDDLQVTILDVPPTTFDPTASGNLNITVNGVAATPASKPKSNGSTVLDFPKPYPDIYASGVTVPVHIEVKSTGGKWFTNDLNILASSYATLPADTKLASAATTSGMAATTFQLPTDASGADIDRTAGWGDDQTGNRIFKAEQELVGGFFDFATGKAYPNNVTTQGNPAQNNVTDVNWEVAAADVAGEFFGSATTPADTAIPNDMFPGIVPGSYTDWFVVEVETFLRFPAAGIYRMGVASDDGFQVTAGNFSPQGTLVGIADVSRGVSETAFEFVVSVPGDYPFRLLYMQGNGGGNCEWYLIDRQTGDRFLVNGPQNNALAIKAFRVGTTRAYLKSISPANNYYFTDVSKPLVITLADGTTQVATSSVQLLINGTDVTSSATVQKSGTTTTVNYLPSGGFPYATVINGQLIWTESTTPATTWTNAFRFCTGGPFPYQFPAGSFWVEAEDFDYGSGQHVATADTMPYTGGAYDGLDGVANVDYNNDDAVSNTAIAYRYMNGDSTQPLNPYPSIATSTTAMLSMLRPFNTTMASNYKIGWSGSPDWYNYTRKIPQGIYTAYGALSNDSGDNSPYDQPALISAPLSKVTAGVGTTTQTYQSLGTFTGPSTGGWSANNLAPLLGPTGKPAYFKIDSATTTLHVADNQGDWDYFILMPETTVPPQLTQIDPKGLNYSVPRNAVIKWTFEDYSTTFNTSSAKLTINGADVPAAQLTATKAGSTTTVTYTPAGLYDIGKVNTYVLTFLDSASKTITTTGTFMANYLPETPAGAFWIEAEDFNYGGGKSNPQAGVAGLDVNVMPYLGNAYTNLNAIFNVDYVNNDTPTNAARLYRYVQDATSATNNILLLSQWGAIGSGEPTDVYGASVDVRTIAGGVTNTVTQGYRIGWADSGDWCDYTRTIPAGQYQAWAALSYGGGSAADQEIGWLYQVGGDATTTNQTATLLGRFDGVGSSGWGLNSLVPLRTTAAHDTATSPTSDASVVTMPGGVTTLRFQLQGADYDYFMLVPVGGVQPTGMKITSATVSAGNIKITWTGGGTLQTATDLKVWADVPGGTGGSYSAAASDAHRFYRVRQ